MSTCAPRAVILPAVLCLAALATLGFPGCARDVTGPAGGGGSSTLTMSNCWPNDDGRYWEYQASSRQLEGGPLTYLPPNSQVPLVTLSDARQMLSDEVPTTPGIGADYPFRLQFDGLMTTLSGVQAQRLSELIPLRQPALNASPAGRPSDAFLARLTAARPDLRPKLARFAPAAIEGDSWYWPPMLIHGYAWSKGPAWIGTYGDVDTVLAWKFLDAMVRPGHTFRHQLVRLLATDIWLNASVERRLAVTVPGGGTVSNAIEVLYLVDYGTANVTDVQGNPIGTFRAFDYGTVVYAPGVGPVKVLERRMGFRGQNTTPGLYRLELNLASTGVVAPPMLAAARRGS